MAGVSLYDWILAHEGQDSPLGDLAEDARNDVNFPRGVQCWTDLREYLVTKNACFAALETAYLAVQEWKGQSEGPAGAENV